MHRVNTKRRQAAILRIFTYGLTLGLSIITTVVLIYVALGYRFDRASGDIVRTGLLLVDGSPTSMNITLGGARQRITPGRFTLKAGSYEVTLNKPGYNSWNKTIEVTASRVEDVRYPILVPEKLGSKAMFSTAGVQMSSQSPDNSKILLQSTNKGALELITLEDNTATVKVLDVSGVVTLTSNQPGRFKVLQWHQNDRFVLLEHATAGGAVEILSLDVANPEQGVNITKLYKNRKLKNIHYAGENVNQVYGLEGTTLARYNLREAQEPVVQLRSVLAYDAYQDGTVSFSRLNKTTNQIEYGLQKDDQVAILQTAKNTRAAATDSITTAYEEFDDNRYFAFSSKNQKTTTIYQNPLNPPILKDQLPFKVLGQSAQSELAFSPGERFILLVNGQTSTVYDFETLKTYQFSTVVGSPAVTATRWITGFNLLYVNKKNQARLLDFDGTNPQALPDVLSNQTLFISPNQEDIYSFTKSGSRTSFTQTPLVLPEN